MKRILIQLSRLLSLRFAALGLTLLQTLAMTRLIGKESFGHLSFALSVSALLVPMLSIGLDKIVMRDLAQLGLEKYSISRRWQRLRRLMVYLQMPIVLGITGLGVAVWSGTSLGGSYSISLIGVSLAVPFVLLGRFTEGAALGLNHVARSIIGSQIAYPLLMIVGTLVIWGLGAVDLRNVTIVYCLAIIGSLITAVLLIWPFLGRLFVQSGNGASAHDVSPSPSELLLSGWYFALISIFSILGQHIDVLITGVFAGPEQVALVRVASRVAEMVGLVRVIAVLQFRPKIAEAAANGDQTALRSQARALVIIFAGSGVALGLSIFIFAPFAMSIFGSTFVEGAPVLRLYLIGVAVTLFSGAGDVLLAMSGRERIVSRLLFFSVSVQVVLDFLLIPYYGAMGCALANTIALCAFGIAAAVVTVREMAIDPTVLSLLRKG